MSNNTIKLFRNALLYSFTLTLAGCNRAASDLGMGQQTTQEIVAVNSARVAKAPALSKKVTRLAGIPLSSFMTVVAILSQLGPVSSGEPVLNLSIPLSAASDPRQLLAILSKENNTIADTPYYELDPDSPCLKNLEDVDLAMGCIEACNVRVQEALSRVQNETEPIIIDQDRHVVFYNHTPSSDSDSDSDSEEYPEFELYRSNGRETFGWLERPIGRRHACRRYNDKNNNKLRNCKLAFRSPPDEFYSIQQEDNITKRIAELRKNARHMSYIKNLTQQCNSENIDMHMGIADGIIQYLDLAERKEAMHQAIQELENKVQKLEDLESRVAGLEADKERLEENYQNQCASCNPQICNLRDKKSVELAQNGTDSAIRGKQKRSLEDQNNFRRKNRYIKNYRRHYGHRSFSGPR